MSCGDLHYYATLRTLSAVAAPVPGYTHSLGDSGHDPGHERAGPNHVASTADVEISEYIFYCRSRSTSSIWDFGKHVQPSRNHPFDLEHGYTFSVRTSWQVRTLEHENHTDSQSPRRDRQG